MRRLSTEDCLRLAAQLQQDGLKVHPLLFFLWQRGWLLAPKAFWPMVSDALFSAFGVAVLATVSNVPAGRGVMGVMVGVLLLCMAIGYWEKREKLSRPLGHVACVAAVVAGTGIWLLWHDDLTSPPASMAPGLALLCLGFVGTFGVVLVIRLIIGFFRRRRWRSLGRWPDYVERALVARLF